MFVLGAIIIGAVAGASVAAVFGPVIESLFNKFWTSIRDWLNNTAADIVQKRLGYNARKAMQKAVNKADRILDKVRNISEVYYRSDPTSVYYDKVTIEATAPTYEYDDEFLKTLEEQGNTRSEMKYIIQE